MLASEKNKEDTVSMIEQAPSFHRSRREKNCLDDLSDDPDDDSETLWLYSRVCRPKMQALFTKGSRSE